MKTPQRKPHKVMTGAELEEKIYTTYTKGNNPQPRTLKEEVEYELKKQI